MDPSRDNSLWNGERGAGGISWIDRSRMGLLRGVIDAGDTIGRRNLYMHTLHLKVLIKELKDAGAVESALDFGCGTGRFIKALATHCAHVCATDKETSMVEAARKYAADCRAEITKCDLTRVPFDNAQFDFVLCSSVLCVTVADAIEDILKELARVTRREGRLLLLEQVVESRGLAVARYANALRSAGFKLVRAYPIRSGDSQFTVTVAGNPHVPSRLFDAIASAELLLTRCKPRQRRSRYIEYAILARRV